MFLWLFVLALVGPCVIPEIPREVARWRLAQALEARQRGDKELASATLAKVMESLPDSPSLLLQRAEWLLEDGKKEEALATAQRIKELIGDEPLWLMAYGQFLQSAGRFQEAVEYFRRIEQISERSGNPPRATALNALAYAQALAQVELAEALQNVNKALELAPGEPALLDTRGYILYLLGQYDLALADLHAAVSAVEARSAGMLQNYRPNADRQFVPSRPKSLPHIDLPEDEAVALIAREVAVLRYHRALILLAMGQEKEADADLARARALIGKEPDATLF
jgi:tetratricopeptide (TPR) repeat protein